jgi:hypothetical protein
MSDYLFDYFAVDNLLFSKVHNNLRLFYQLLRCIGFTCQSHLQAPHNKREKKDQVPVITSHHLVSYRKLPSNQCCGTGTNNSGPGSGVSEKPFPIRFDQKYFTN